MSTDIQEQKPSAGRLAQRKGKKLEKLIEGALMRQKLHPAIERKGLKASYRPQATGKAKLQRHKSGCDFEGGYRATATAFDAKSTKGKSMPMRDLTQTTRIKNRHAEGWIAFYLVEFSDLPDGPEYFALTWPALKPYWDEYSLNGDPASIPLAWFQQTAYRIKSDRYGLDLADLFDRMQRGMSA